MEKSYGYRFHVEFEDAITCELSGRTETLYNTIEIANNQIILSIGYDDDGTYLGNKTMSLEISELENNLNKNKLPYWICGFPLEYRTFDEMIPYWSEHINKDEFNRIIESLKNDLITKSTIH